MRGIKAKALRKLVFQSTVESRERKYVRRNNGQIVNMANVEAIVDGTGKDKYVAKRNLYRKLKITTRRIPINQVKTVITGSTNESTQKT